MNSLLYILFLVQAISYSVSKGFYYPAGLIALIITTVVIFIIYRQKKLPGLDIYQTNDQHIIPIVLFVSLCLNLIFSGGMYQSNLIFILGIYLIFSLAIILASFYFIKPKSRVAKRCFLWLAGCAITLRLFMVLSSPNPLIDVYTHLKMSSRQVLKGQDPYSLTFPNPSTYAEKTSDQYSYLPLSFIYFIPFEMLTKDPRFGIIFADVVTFLVLFKLARKKMKELPAQQLALSYLFLPSSLFFLEQSFIDSVLFMLITLFIYFLVEKRSYILQGLLLGCALSFKHIFYSVLIIPPLLRFGLSKKILTAALCSTMLLVMPFLVWNQPDFLSDTLFGSIFKFTDSPRFDSLSLNSFWFFLTGQQIDSVFILAGFFFLFLFTLSNQPRKNMRYAILSMFLIFQGFFLINRFAFLNYYQFTSSLLLLSFTL